MTTQVSANPGQPVYEGGTIMGHPKGLFVLFLTEMWERMSYYGMRALLVTYLVTYLFKKENVGQEVFGFDFIKGILESIFGPLASQPLASQIYGLYTGFVYLTPVFGGIIADRWWGQRRTVVVGAVLMIIGHFLMAMESLLFPALFLLILGNGAFKPNISTQVGSLYAPGDPRRDGAFTIFYMGINLGAMLGGIVSGSLGQLVGWHWGFGAAGVGMVLGLIVYLVGQKYIQPHPENVVAKAKEEKSHAGDEKLTGSEWKSIGALVALCALNVIFWCVYEQQGNTMQLWANDYVNWNIGSFTIPSLVFQSLNPFLIFILAPLLSKLWLNQASRGKEPTSVTKMAIGCFLLGSAFVVMIVAAQNATPGQASMMWLLGTTTLLTIGEIYLSPVGLSLVTKVAPMRMVSMMMGIWFLSSFFGNYLSGYVGTYYETMAKNEYFGIMAIMAAVAGVAMVAFNKPLKSALGNK